MSVGAEKRMMIPDEEIVRQFQETANSAGLESERGPARPRHGSLWLRDGKTGTRNAAGYVTHCLRSGLRAEGRASGCGMRTAGSAGAVACDAGKFLEMWLVAPSTYSKAPDGGGYPPPQN